MLVACRNQIEEIPEEEDTITFPKLPTNREQKRSIWETLERTTSNMSSMFGRTKSSTDHGTSNIFTSMYSQSQRTQSSPDQVKRVEEKQEGACGVPLPPGFGGQRPWQTHDYGGFWTDEVVPGATCESRLRISGYAGNLRQGAHDPGQRGMPDADAGEVQNYSRSRASGSAPAKEEKRSPLGSLTGSHRGKSFQRSLASLTVSKQSESTFEVESNGAATDGGSFSCKRPTPVGRIIKSRSIDAINRHQLFAKVSHLPISPCLPWAPRLEPNNSRLRDWCVTRACSCWHEAAQARMCPHRILCPQHRHLGQVGEGYDHDDNVH